MALHSINMRISAPAGRRRSGYTRQVVQPSISLTVAGATKAGHTFDLSNSAVLSDKIEIGFPINEPRIAIFNADTVDGNVPLIAAEVTTGLQTRLAGRRYDGRPCWRNR